MTPIVLASTFAQDGPGQHKGYDYSRAGNPTRSALEACLAALEGAKHCAAFGSGCAVTTALLLTLKAGDHVLCGDDVYGGTFRIFDAVMKRFGLEATFLDNTFATPMLQQPLDLGATASVHSTTKYLNGHSDVVGGAAMTNDDALAEKLHFLQKTVGGVPSPFDCYLVLRGLKTLAVRMERHSASAAALAAWLVKHPQVERVYFPGLPTHPGHALAARQMVQPGGMISFELRGGLPAARALLKALSVFVCAESLGGVESLAEHPAIMTHASLPPEARKALGIGDGLIRLSVGLEAEADLRADLERGLAAAGAV